MAISIAFLVHSLDPFSGSFAKCLMLTSVAKHDCSTTPVGAVSNRTDTQHYMVAKISPKLVSAGILC